MGSFSYYLASFVVGLLLYSITSVPEGKGYVVERLGRYTRTLTPGINFIVPILDRVGHKMDMTKQVRYIPEQTVITRDNVRFSIDSEISYQVMDAASAAYQAGNPDWAIREQAAADVQAIALAMEADELHNHPRLIGDRLLAAMKQAATPWGIRIIGLEVKSISPAAKD